MAEEMNEIKAPEAKSSLYESFMKAGKITVFESGLERPDHIQERPFFNLLEKGATSFINAGEQPDTLQINTAEEQAESPYLDTEAHKFFEGMEKRFRTVMPGVTLFIIDPDAVQGRYLMDQEADRSLGKSLYMFVEDKLQKASAGNGQTFLTQEEILKSVSEAGITDRNPFSMRANVAPTVENLAGLGKVNLVVGDNPDAMSANVLDMVLGAEERRVKEGVSFDEFRRLVLYHELGHATDNNYASGYDSIEKVVENDMDNVMKRHRTECIADAHAVLQLARDFGDTKCAALWGDCRIEYLRISVDRRLEDTKYDSEFISKLRAAEKVSHAVDPNSSAAEQKYITLMNDRETADVIKKLGSPLAYHTTDVIDATIKYAEEHLKDGSLQKMSDYEVIKQAQFMSENYGLTREEMAGISLALASGEKHPKYEQMMERVSESRDRMPISRKKLDKEYEMQRELKAYSEEVGLCKGLGLPVPGVENLSKDLLKKLQKDQVQAQEHEMMASYAAQNYQGNIFGKLLASECTREDMLEILSVEKETLRTKGKKDKNKDKHADIKLKVVDAIIEQAPKVQQSINANKRVKGQVEKIKSDTVVSGEEAIVHFVKHELRSMNAMQKALSSALQRDTDAMTVQHQIDVLRFENKEFGKALISEKEMQIAAFAIRSDKETWAKVSQNEGLASLIDQKAKQKPAGVLSDYQTIVGKPDKETTAQLLQEAFVQHAEIAMDVVNDEKLAKIFSEKAPTMMQGLKRLDKQIKKEMQQEQEQQQQAQNGTNIKNTPLSFRKAQLNSGR